MLQNPTIHAAIAPDGVNDLRFHPRMAMREAMAMPSAMDLVSNGFIGVDA